MGVRKNSIRGGETGAVRKHWGGRISVCLVFPNRYHIAMSNLGFQTVYGQLNRMDRVVCERAFLAESNALTLRSLESNRPLTDFDMVAFSLSFENDFPNILTILESANIPWLSGARSGRSPLLAAGGVASFLNPEPVAPFFDLILIGESEAMLPRFFEYYDPAEDRRENLLKIVRNVPGVYAPSFYSPEYGPDGVLTKFAPVENVPERVCRTFAADISEFSTTSSIIAADTAFSDSFLVEVSRGCAHGCRFCGAGFVYRPPRFRPLSQLTENIETGAAVCENIGLMGAAVSDHPDVDKLCELAAEKNIRLSFSSLRADAINDNLTRALKKSGVKTAAIAPDAGSPRLRTVINKGVGEDHVLSAAEALVAAGIPNLKLYFMIGLPTETREDVEAIVSLCKKTRHRFLQSSRARKRIGQITVSLNSFVPKPFTPFQWAGMDDIASLKKKIQIVKNGLKKTPNLKVHADVPRWAHIQGLFSRGDRRVSALIARSVKNGGNWPETFKESPLNADFYTLRQRGDNELFPWDFIDSGVKKSFLFNEYKRALAEKSTPPCPVEKSCEMCGVCGAKLKEDR